MSERAEQLLKTFIEAFDKGAVELSSQEVGDTAVDIMPHPWHGEWLHYAREEVQLAALRARAAIQ